MLASSAPTIVCGDGGNTMTHKHIEGHNRLQSRHSTKIHTQDCWYCCSSTLPVGELNQYKTDRLASRIPESILVSNSTWKGKVPFHISGLGRTKKSNAHVRINVWYIPELLLYQSKGKARWACSNKRASSQQAAAPSSPSFRNAVSNKQMGHEL